MLSIKNMKKILSIICGLSLFLGGCDFLDIVPEDDIKTIEKIFEQREQVDDWVATCYRDVNSQASIFANVAYTGADELVGNDVHRQATGFMGYMQGLLIGDGLQSALRPVDDSWGSYYSSIRYCNTFFENIDRTHNMEEDEKALWIAEVKAVKAFYYFQLVRKYGPIILLDNTIGVEGDLEEMRLPREHVDTCFNEIVRLLDEAIEVLPLKAEKEALRQGYFYKESAMALKAIALVYQASPLFNGNPAYVDVTERDGTPLFSATPDKEKWHRAALACDEAIDVCEAAGWVLVQGNSNGSDLRNVMKDIELSVQAPGCQSNEILMMAKQSNSAPTASLHFYAHTLPVFRNDFQLNSPPSTGSLSPSMKMVEMYYTKNGLPIDEDRNWHYEDRYEMGQEMSDEYDRVVPKDERVLNLHLEREPRFYAHIAFDRGYWQGVIQNVVEETRKPMVIYARKGETFGTDLPSLQSKEEQNRSGYWLLKYIFTDLTVDNYVSNVASKGEIPMPVIRLAQLYLMSSEAWNEYYDSPSGHEEVYAGIDKVRVRAGIPPVREAWRQSTRTDKPNSQAGMREIIHREMAIEFAFEGQRFWDLRRWLEAQDELNEPQYGWNVVASDEAGFYNNFQGPVVVWSLRNFQSPRDYLWPLNSEEVMKSGFVQNPGW